MPLINKALNLDNHNSSLLLVKSIILFSQNNYK